MATIRLRQIIFCLLLGSGLGITTSSVSAQSDADARVWKVKISGNETFENMVIKNVISNEPPSLMKKMRFWKRAGMRFNENEIRRDVIRIERFYQRRGFNDVIVSYRVNELNKPWKKGIYFDIIENTPIRITSVQHKTETSTRDSAIIFQSENFNRIKRRLPFKEGRRFAPVNINQAQGSLSDALKNLGFAYASSEITSEVDSVAKTADLTVNFYPGPRTRFDSVLVEGESTLNKKYIIRESGIKKGELFSENKLRDAQREVFNHHLLRFALVSIPPQEIDTTINMLIRVQETPLRAIELKFGMGNLTRIDGPEEFYKLFRGQASWTHRNVRGTGELFRVSAGASAIEQRVGVDYRFPYLFNTKSSLNLSPFLQHKLEPSYEILRGGMTNSFVYQYNPNLTGTVSYEFTLNNEFTQSSQEELPDSILSYNVSSFNLSGYYANNLRPGQQGWSFLPSLELSGLFGIASYNFQKLSLDIRKYTEITDDIIFAKRLNVSGIYLASQDSLPSDIRVYNGGTNSVRGWNRLELGPKRAILEEGEFQRYVSRGGRATMNFNMELRIQLYSLIRGFGFAAFLDGGQVWRKIDHIGDSPIQYGAGGGLRYQSPIGPIRVDVAYKLNPTDQDLNIYQGQDYGGAWDRWGLHFSIGQAF